MSSGVVDSSVILAMLRREPNADQFLADLDETVVSTVILGEVISKLVAIGMNVDDAWRDARSVIDRVVSFDEHQAKLAGEFVKLTKPHGLSLGDRSCLALGSVLQLPVYTADQVWEKVQVGVEVLVVR